MEKTGLTAQIKMKIVVFDVEQWLLTFSHQHSPDKLASPHTHSNKCVSSYFSLLTFAYELYTLITAEADENGISLAAVWP